MSSVLHDDNTPLLQNESIQLQGRRQSVAIPLDADAQLEIEEQSHKTSTLPGYDPRANLAIARVVKRRHLPYIVGFFSIMILLNIFALGERQLRELNANKHLQIGPFTFLSLLWVVDILVGCEIVVYLFFKLLKKLLSPFQWTKVLFRRYSSIVNGALILLFLDLTHGYSGHVLNGPDQDAVDRAVISINSACLGVGLLHLAVNVFFHAREFADESSINSENKYARLCERALSKLLNEPSMTRSQLDQLPLNAFACQGLAQLDQSLSNTGDAINVREAANQLAKAALAQQNGLLDLDRHSWPADGTLFDAFDVDKDGKVNIGDLTHAIIGIYRARVKISGSASTQNLVLEVGELIADVLAWIFSFVWALVAFDISLSSFFVPLGTTLVAISFAYASTLQELWDSLYLIFVVQPFYAGDMISIGGEDNPMTVERIGAMSTFFTTTVGQSVWMRNYSLSRQMLFNHHRSKFVLLQVDLLLAPNSTADQVTMLTKALTRWLTVRKELWSPTPRIYVEQVSSSVFNREGFRQGMQLNIRCKRKHVTWQERAVWKSSRTKLIQFLESYLSEQDLHGQIVEEPR